MPAPEEMTDCQFGPVSKIGCHDVAGHAIDRPQDLDERHAPCGELLGQRRRRALGRADQDAIDPMFANAAQKPVLPLDAIVGIGEEGEAARGFERVVYAGGQLGIERISDLRHDQPNRSRDPGPQPRRAAIVDVANAGDGVFDALAGR